VTSLPLLEPDVIALRVEEQFAARHQDFDRASRWATHPELLSLFVSSVDARHHEVLEVCCGTGLVGGALAAQGVHVVGYDVSPQMLSLAARRVSEVVCGDAHMMPFPDGSFERIVLRQAWHFLHPVTVPRELFRVASPGAVLVTGQIVPFGAADAGHLERIHRAKQRDLAWFPTEDSLTADLSAAGWVSEGVSELLISEEMGAWLEHAPETGSRISEVQQLIREAPEPYRSLHNVHEDEHGLWDDFRWVVMRFRKPLSGPRVAPWLLALLRCPACASPALVEEDDQLVCRRCRRRFLIDAGVPQMCLD
jgi:DNA gyrase subunit B